MIEIKKGNSLGVRLQLAFPSGTRVNLRKSKYLRVTLGLPNAATQPVNIVSFDEITNAVYVKLTGSDLSVVGDYSITLNVQSEDGQMLSTKSMKTCSVSETGDTGFKELTLGVEAYVLQTPTSASNTGSSPAIDPATGNWLVYDDKAKAYVNSGVSATLNEDKLDVVKKDLEAGIAQLKKEADDSLKVLSDDTNTKYTSLDTKTKELQKVIEYKKIDSLADIDLIRPTGNNRIYGLQIGGPGDTSILTCAFFGVIDVQHLITPHTIDASGNLEAGTGSLTKCYTYSRAKNRSSTEWNKWIRMIDQEDFEDLKTEMAQKESLLDFDELIESAAISLASTIAAGEVVYVKDKGKFALRITNNGSYEYYANWNNRPLYQNDFGVPLTRRYIDSRKNTYEYADGLLKRMSESVIVNDMAEFAIIDGGTV